MPVDFSEIDDSDLIQSYGLLLKELRSRQIIRTKNIVGDMGEYMAIDYYKRTPSLPNLQAAPTGTQNVDALSRDGNRYSIKTTTGKVTGVFYGLPPKGSDEVPDRKFEFAVIVILGDDYQIKKILEINWDQFLEVKRWHSRMSAWNISITQELISKSTTIFPLDDS